MSAMFQGLPNLRAMPQPAEAFLTTDQAMAAAKLQAEINVLREARECVTDTCTPDVIYGRVDGLISFRQEQLLAVYRDARAAELQGVHDRG